MPDVIASISPADVRAWVSFDVHKFSIVAANRAAGQLPGPGRGDRGPVARELEHLNLPEWGSPRLPLIPESLILHHADDLDAKLEMYVRCLTRDTNDGPFTARDPVLNRPLFKGRTV